MSTTSSSTVRTMGTCSPLPARASSSASLLTGESFRFKSSVYVYGANHGQFNSTWGRTDNSFPSKNFLNLRHIMPEPDQAQIARVYIAAFFEASLNEERGYLPLFPRRRAPAGRGFPIRST